MTDKKVLAELDAIMDSGEDGETKVAKLRKIKARLGSLGFEKAIMNKEGEFEKQWKRVTADKEVCRAIFKGKKGDYAEER